jgi:hypothetical protein
MKRLMPIFPGKYFYQPLKIGKKFSYKLGSTQQPEFKRSYPSCVNRIWVIGSPPKVCYGLDTDCQKF